MEIIRKKIYLENEKSYFLNVLLTTHTKDIGFFDVVPFLEISDTIVNLNDVGVGSFRIDTNLKWFLEYKDSWILIDKIRGYNDTILTINAQPNDTNKQRISEVLIYGVIKNANPLMCVLTIKQKPK